MSVRPLLISIYFFTIMSLSRVDVEGDEEGNSSAHATDETRSARIRDAEEIPCDSQSNLLLRNGLGDNSFFLWPDGIVPYVIGNDFDVDKRRNVEEALNEYNKVFEGCLMWKERSGEPVYVEFLNSGGCHSQIGRAYWPFPLPQAIYIGECSHLLGHIKHEMMHTLGFYHEHSRSDRDRYVEILWDNIKEARKEQFYTFRWTTAYGESYDYESIMHYSANAFSRNPDNPEVMTIVPTNDLDPLELGKRSNLSRTDVVKIKKMYKCDPYQNWHNDCGSDADCGENEFCDTYVLNGQCRTLLSDDSLCYRSSQCLNDCVMGACGHCTSDSDCDSPTEYCAYKYLPLVGNRCEGYCGSFCLISYQCEGSCSTCDWNFQCS